MAPRRPEALIGREIAGQFRLDRYLGRGRSTLVFAALDLVTGDEVAIKLLASSLTSDVGFMRRFRHVLRAASEMDHPNVLRVIAWGEERELFVVTELMAGPLRSVLRPGGGLSAGQTAAMAVDASRALAFLSQRNLVHRRLHPSNLLVSADGRVVVGDAGLAWILAHHSGHQFSDFRYLAPEVGGGSAGAPLDVYALGLIMIETLCGDIPMLAADVNATLGMRHDRDVRVGQDWGRIGRAIGAAGRADPNRRVPAAQLDVGLMALIDQLGGSRVDLPHVDPAAYSDELEAMRLIVRSRAPAVAPAGVPGPASRSERSAGGQPATARQAEPSTRPVGSPGSSTTAPRDPTGSAGLPPTGRAAGPTRSDPTEVAAGPTRSDPTEVGASAAPGASGSAAGGTGIAAGGTDTAEPPARSWRRPKDGPTAAERLKTAQAGAGAALNRLLVRWHLTMPADQGAEGDVPNPDAPTAEQVASRRTWVFGLLAAMAIVLVLFVGVQRLVLAEAGTVPNLVGATEQEARQEATEQRWRLNVTEVRRDGTEVDEILTQSPDEGTRLEAGESLDITVSIGQTLVNLPDLDGLDRAEAEAIITFSGMKLGTVTNQYDAETRGGIILSYDAPGEDGKVPKGSKVNLVISDGARPRKVPADLAGKNALDVAQALEKVSLKPVVERVQDPSVQLGYVVSVEPASGTEVEFESEVKVRVSSPRDKAIVPDVAGKSTLQADADLRAAGLNVLGIQGPPGNPVLRTIPAAGTEVSQGTAVRLVTA
ncbi:Stk1 family PASTA domain-containing Ser/Thr kinase [Candidatus Neomicrothrix sp.]|nr:Stk1 family PASTA domain-containing Ser/Thr kinase [Candidatus Microthrix sp.]HMS47261.1 PASTA domain-containing protein [Candidatus Microthrix sp.]